MIGEATLRLARFLTASEYRSGEAIARELGCTRSAVWKQVGSLRDLGIGVEASAGLGYRLQQPLELLEADAILGGCGSETQEFLAGLQVRPETDSTNAELLRPGRGQRHGRAIVAEFQSDGQGRRGRTWHSPFGRNVYLSLGWRFEQGLGRLSCLPLVVAIAASLAVHRTGLEQQKIKWPNDLVLDGRKLGGCLVEIHGDVNGPCLAVVGVGVNVHMPPDVHEGPIDQPWTDIGRHQPTVSRNRLASALLDELVTGLRRFERQGFGPSRELWQRLDALEGQEVELYQQQETIRGIARGVGTSGGLLLESNGKTDEYLAGEVTLSKPGT